jgi:signal transduction histidine kinase
VDSHEASVVWTSPRVDRADLENPIRDEPTARAADALFEADRQRIYRQADRMFAGLMILQWIAGIVFAVWVSPAVSRAPMPLLTHLWAALALGGVISLVPALLALLRPGAPSTRYTVATAQMLMGALLIHLSGGRIETHFHVFGSLAFLAFYRDWRVLVPATVVVAADHLLRGIYWPQSVYGIVAPDPWRWLEHVAWVVFEDVFLAMACVRGTRELRAIADRTAVLERAHTDQARLAIERGELVERLRLSQQELEAATRAKSEFVANVSHELRTPLNAITLYGELLHEQARSDRRDGDAADLGKIVAASRHLLGLINGVLDLSKIEAGRMELDVQTFEVEPVVEELAATVTALIGQNGNTLQVRCGPHLGSMHSDLTRIRQILFNLLSNASKFTSRGTVSLRADRLRADGIERIRFEVADTGIGLTREQRARIFRPFAQADSSTARTYGGTGLGLSLVWRFCELLGGSVDVDSQPGQGARFTVVLPVRVEPVAQSDVDAEGLCA